PAGSARPWSYLLVVPLPLPKRQELTLDGPDAPRLLDVDGQDPAADHRMHLQSPQQARLALEAARMVGPHAAPEHLQHDVIVAVAEYVRLVTRRVRLDGFLELVGHRVGDAASSMRQVQKNAGCNLHPARPLAYVLHVGPLPGDGPARVDTHGL